MAAISLFWDTNMAAVTSCENTLYSASRDDCSTSKDRNFRVTLKARPNLLLNLHVTLKTHFLVSLDEAEGNTVVSFSVRAKTVQTFYTCISSSDRKHCYQAVFILLELIAQVLADSGWCSAINANVLVLLTNNKKQRCKLTTKMLEFQDLQRLVSLTMNFVLDLEQYKFPEIQTSVCKGL